MAESRPGSRSPDLKEDALVAALVPDPTSVPNATTLDGFLGRSPTEGTWRLYLDQDLNEYVELRESEILHAQELPAHRGTRVWVSKDLVLTYVRVDSSQIQAAFLSGSISAGRLPTGGTPGGIQNVEEFIALESRLSCPPVSALLGCHGSIVECTGLGGGSPWKHSREMEEARGYIQQPMTSPAFCAPTALLLIPACREKAHTHVAPC